MNKKQPWRDLLVEDLSVADIVLLGIPFDENCSCGEGTRFAPDKLRELSGYLPPVTENGEIIFAKLFDFGNVDKEESIEFFFKKVATKAFEVISSGKFPIFLGGDHSVSIPLKQAFAKFHQGKRIGIIHFDAHADICDIYDDSKLSHASVNARALETGFKDSDIMMVGIRSFEIQELSFLENHPHQVLLASQLDSLKETGIANEIITYFASFDAIYLSVDIDVLDPAYAPGTGTPEAGGLSSRRLINIIRKLVQQLPIKAMDLVEISPPRDVNDITSWAGLKLLLEVFSIKGQKKGRN
ncbi:MAG: agmatinase [Bacilli bacterium]|nr:agmatinase [Bacilli bacterium]HHU24508.1 agmatinase [Acholeplasmataceae bacterium]